MNNLEDYFSKKFNYEDQTRKKMREAYKLNKVYVPRCIFCNEKGGTLFQATYDNYVISCKENKCDNREVYKRYKKTSMDNKIKYLDNKVKIMKDELIEISNLKNNNMKELKTVNIEKYDNDLNDIFLKKSEMEENENKRQTNINNHLMELEEFKANLVKDLKDHNSKDIINYEAVVEINRNIQKVDNEIYNVKFEVKYVEDNIDTGIRSMIKDAYNCPKEDTYNLILRDNCIETNEVDV